VQAFVLRLWPYQHPLRQFGNALSVELTGCYIHVQAFELRLWPHQHPLRQFGNALGVELIGCYIHVQAFELRLWPHQHPLRQFGNALGVELINKLEERELGVDQLRDMEHTELAAILRSPVGGRTVASTVAAFPTLHLTAHLHPLTRFDVAYPLLISSAICPDLCSDTVLESA
jgi:hypothetical protein